MRPRFLPLLLLLALLVPSDHARRGAADPDRHGRDERDYPSDWFGLQRAFPSGTIDSRLVDAAVERVRFDRAAQIAALRDARVGLAPLTDDAVTTAALTWQQAGPYNIGGRVTALAVVPGGTTAYLGAANGGVFKSTNSGTNWTPIFDGLEIYSIGALTLDPANSSTVYVGTGEANNSVDSYDGAGLFRSQDGGSSWAYLGLQQTRRIARVAVDPANSQRIFVAAMGTQFSTGPDRGLYRSEDGGNTWSQVLYVSDSTGATDVRLNPAHPETVYCATMERVRHNTYRRAYGPECGIWRSADHGSTWTRLSSGLPAPSDNVGRIGLAIAPSQPSTIYAQIGSGASGGYVGLGLYRSTDGGQTWTRRDTDGNFPGNFGGFVWYFGDMAVDPTNANVIYALGQYLIRSADGGVTWANLAPGSLHPDHHALWINPSNSAQIYEGSDGGFYSTTNTGTTWTKSMDLPISQFYAGSIDASSPTHLVGGTQDNGCLETYNSPTAWTQYNGGDGFYCLVDPTSSSIRFGEFQFGSQGAGPSRFNGGTENLPSGINGGDRFNWDTPYVMDPSNHNVLLVGSQLVYKSLDNGSSYTAVSGDLTSYPNPPASLVYHTISTLDVSPHNANIYYAGTDDGRVWRSLNAGGTWTDITAGLPLFSITRVTADPAKDSTVYVTLSGFSSDEHTAHVFRSTNAGNTWTSVAGNLPNAPANDILVDPTDPSTLYLATDFGVYITRNLGSTWYALGQGMPVQTVFDLTLHSASRTLVASTHGRSMWKLDLSALPTGVPGAPAPPRLALSAPAPNPSAGRAAFAVELARAARLDVGVFDAAGRDVRRLYSGFAGAGRMSLTWDGFDEHGRRSPAGVYFVRASSEGASRVQRLVRIR
jgi:photosystem II stability/assembly factor-like uncharacterized protein